MGRGPDNQPLRADADSDGASGGSIRNPKLASLIGREVTSDNFDMLRIEFYEQGYHLSMDADGFGRIRRRNGGRSDGLPKLYHDVETGKILEGMEGSNRISRSGALRRSLAGQAGRDMLPDHVAHHLVPDEVVRKHPLFEHARRRGDPPYDLDNASNGVELRRNADVDGDVGMPTHSGSHPEWNRLASSFADRVRTQLVREHGSLDAVPAADLTSGARAVEEFMRGELRSIERRAPIGRLR
jgi:hypothetical protein